MSMYPWNETNITFTWLSSLYNPFKKAGLQWLSSNKRIIQILSNQPQTACCNMDGCYKCCGRNTVCLTYELLQVLPWNNNTIIEKTDGCNRCRQITDFIQYIHSWNQGGIIINNYDISMLQLLFCKNIVHLKECMAKIFFVYNRKKVNQWMGGCNWNCKLTQYLSNICQYMHCIYPIHGCKCSSKKYRVHWRMDGRSYFREIKKQCTLKKSCSLQLTAVTYKEKHFSGTTTLGHTLFVWATISLRFLYTC